MNFDSQICTTEEQSKRLIALGLKAETADMRYRIVYFDLDGILLESAHSLEVGFPINNDGSIPAWSLHRLIEMYSEHYVCEHINLKLLTYDTIIEDIRLDILTGTFNKEYLEQ